MLWVFVYYLGEVIVMNTHNICFEGELNKIVI